MLDDVGGEHDVEVAAHLVGEAVVEVGLHEVVHPVVDAGRLGEVDARHPVPCRGRAPRRASPARSRRRGRASAGRCCEHCRIRPCELYGDGLYAYGSVTWPSSPAPNPERPRR